MNFDIIHSGMVGFLALLGTLLISLAVMIYDRTSDNSKFKITSSKTKNERTDDTLKADIDDTFPWEKTVLLRHVAMAPFLFASFVLASVSLITLGFEICWIRVVLFSVYFLSVAFICTRIWRLGEWLYSQASISMSETYRQKMKYKFLNNISSDEDLVNIWSITWNNISAANPYQVDYLRIYLKHADLISDSINTWNFIEVFLQNAKTGNVNILRPDIQKLLLEYSLDALDRESKTKQKVHIKFNKRRIIDTLIELAITKDESILGCTFNIIDDYLKKCDDRLEIMYNFAIQFFSTIDKTKIDTDRITQVFSWFPHSSYGVVSLLNDSKNKSMSKQYAQIWLFAYDGWFKRNYAVDPRRIKDEKYDNDKRIDSVTKAFLGDGYFMQISERLFGDLLVFYGLNGWAVDKDEKTTEDSWVRIFANSQRLFMSYDMYTTGIDYRPDESDEERQKRALAVMDLQSGRNDKNAITILRYLFPLSNADHIKNVLESIKRYRKKIGENSEDVRISRLNRLEYDFKLIKKYNNEAKNNSSKKN